MNLECKECGKKHKSQKNLHKHIKAHGLYLGEYYVKHYPRKDKLTGKQIEFKTVDQYFSTYFNKPANMHKWLYKASDEEAREFILKILKHRITSKDLKKGPSYLYLSSADLPTIDQCKKVFGSYYLACQELDVAPLYKDPLPKEFDNDYSGVKIYIDTREQKPLCFKNSDVLKLDVGDYVVSKENFNHTYVDRKSFADFCCTVTRDYKRFLREIERCKNLGCYLFIVIECDYKQIYKVNANSYKKHNLKYVFSKMREIEVEYGNCCQFVFSGSRKLSELIIPKILVLGKSLWNVDFQYWWNKKLKENNVGDRTPRINKQVRKYKRRIRSRKRLFRRGKG